MNDTNKPAKPIQFNITATDEQPAAAQPVAGSTSALRYVEQLKASLGDMKPALADLKEELDQQRISPKEARQRIMDDVASGNLELN